MRKEIHRKIWFVAILLVCAVALGAQTNARYSLVIGNGTYTDLGTLKNTRNDAEDMAAALHDLGFEVTTLFDADLIQMEDAVLGLSNKLSVSPNAIGLFYYAGHGVQSGGMNYLIPADARIPGEAYLRTKALNVQSVLDNLQSARNALNIVILDACRDNPYSWARSGTRGLSVVSAQPPGSIIVYATSAGSVAQDGTGKNGVFTGELLKNLKTPGLDVMEVFSRTGEGVQRATLGRQTPALYTQFFGKVYLAGSDGSAVQAMVPLTPPAVSQKLYGSAYVKTESAGELYVDGVKADSLRAGGQMRLSGQEAGRYIYEMRYPSGEKETRTVQVEQDKEMLVSFGWKPQEASAAVVIPQAAAPVVPSGLVEMVYVEGGSFMMGSETGDSDERPVHTVSLSPSFYMGMYEVTQEQYQQVMGTNPSEFKSFTDASKRPVEKVSWYDSVLFCNLLSQNEGLEPAYYADPAFKTIINNATAYTDGTNAYWKRDAKGYRLPTEAEWEYAAKGGNKARGYIYAGYNNLAQAAWYKDNSASTTHPVGLRAPNELGLYDMLGNVWEWCWDWYNYWYYYSKNPNIDPTGADSGAGRVCRGGSWDSVADDCRLARRGNSSPGYRHDIFLGFRVARGP